MITLQRDLLKIRIFFFALCFCFVFVCWAWALTGCWSPCYRMSGPSSGVSPDDGVIRASNGCCGGRLGASLRVDALSIAGLMGSSATSPCMTDPPLLHAATTYSLGVLVSNRSISLPSALLFWMVYCYLDHQWHCSPGLFTRDISHFP